MAVDIPTCFSLSLSGLSLSSIFDSIQLCQSAPNMDVLAFLLLFLAMAGHSTATWCICKDGVSDDVLQKTLDYACGTGADCGLIHQNGACFQPNTVKAHCSYAVNSFFQRKGQAQGSCDFAATANIITSNPSLTGCVYPSSSTTGATSSTNNSNPYTGTSNGVLGDTGSVSDGAGINRKLSYGRSLTLFFFFCFLVW